jgi:hypothetical protein
MIKSTYVNAARLLVERSEIEANLLQLARAFTEVNR